MYQKLEKEMESGANSDVTSEEINIIRNWSCHCQRC